MGKATYMVVWVAACVLLSATGPTAGEYTDFLHHQDIVTSAQRGDLHAGAYWRLGSDWSMFLELLRPYYQDMKSPLDDDRCRLCHTTVAQDPDALTQDRAPVTRSRHGTRVVQSRNVVELVTCYIVPYRRSG
ncbi:MAG: hypothetical protein ABIF77_14565 [bacterium]